MKKLELNKENNARAFVSVNDLLLYLIESTGSDEVKEKAISCGFSQDIAEACEYFASFKYLKKRYEEALIDYRNYYYLYNELKPENTKEWNNQFLNFTCFTGDYKSVALRSIELLEKFSEGKLLIREPKVSPSNKDISFFDYVNSNKCYKEELTIYFENYPELLFSFNFHDDEESRHKEFRCYLHVYSLQKDFEIYGDVQLDCAPREYNNVCQYFSNRFIRFMAHVILVNFYKKDANNRASIAFYLYEYLKLKGILLPESKYPFYSDGQYPMDTKIDTLVVDNKGSIQSVNSIISKINEMERQRGVKENHMTLLNFYLQGVVEKEIDGIHSHNLRNLENEYKSSRLKH